MRLFRTTVGTVRQRPIKAFATYASTWFQGSFPSGSTYWAASFALFFSGLCYRNLADGTDDSLKYLPQFAADTAAPLPTQRESDPFLTFPALSEGPEEKGRMAEEQLVERALEDVQPASIQPGMFSIGDIMSWAKGMASHAGERAQSAITYCIITECDSLKVAGIPCMNGSIRQIASQFDSSESRYYYLTHPRDFKGDPTQGPSEQRTAYTAALARWIHKDYCNSLSALQKYPEFDQYFDYRFGHLTPRLGHEEQGLSFLRAHVDEIRLNVQRVGIDGTQNTAIQVLNAGMALGSFDADSEQRTTSGQQAVFQMSNLLLTAEYKAVAAVAIAEAQKYPNKEIPVSFTLVGAGMFGNDKKAVSNGINAACELIAKSGMNNIVPCLSVYFPEEVEQYRTGYFKNAPVVNQMTLSTLSRLSEAKEVESASHFKYEP